MSTKLPLNPRPSSPATGRTSFSNNPQLSEDDDSITGRSLSKKSRVDGRDSASVSDASGDDPYDDNLNPTNAKNLIDQSVQTITTLYKGIPDRSDRKDSVSDINADDDDFEEDDTSYFSDKEDNPTSSAEEILKAVADVKRRLAANSDITPSEKLQLKQLLNETEAVANKATKIAEANKCKPLPMMKVKENLQRQLQTLADLHAAQKKIISQVSGQPHDKSADGLDNESSTDSLNGSGATDANSSLTSGSINPKILEMKYDKIRHAIDVIDLGNNALLSLRLPSEENKKSVENIIKRTEALLALVESDQTTNPTLYPDNLSITLQSQLISLRRLYFELDNYVSPHAIEKKLSEKEIYVDAAIKALDGMIAFAKNSGKQTPTNREKAMIADAESIQEMLKDRKRRISKHMIIRNDDRSVADASVSAEVMARHTEAIRRNSTIKKASLRASNPRSNDKGRASHAQPTGSTQSSVIRRILGKYEKSLSTIEPDVGPHEKAWLVGLIDDFLAAYPEASNFGGRQLLRDFRAEVLNRERNWDVIESSVKIPIGIPKILQEASSGSSPAKNSGNVLAAEFGTVRAVTKPVGHVFNQPGLSVLSNDSPVKATSFRDYKAKDPLNPATEITTGLNSHSSVEHLHGVNVARSEASVDGKMIFHGTRHATLSPYDLYPETLKKAGRAVLDKIMLDLLSHAGGVTRIQTKKSAPDKQIGAANPKAGVTELDKLWEEKTGRLDGKEFIKKLTSDDQICALARRKAALNRAREVFLSEALGNPVMLERIREGNPISFNSISLITPDLLRHFLAKLIPSKFRRKDELTMRREEAQAWKDLQDEINANRLVIDGKVVFAEIVSFSVGVNQLSLNEGSALQRSLTSGWNQVEDDNLKAMNALMGDPAKINQGEFGGQVGRTLSQLKTEINQVNSKAPKDRTPEESAAVLAKTDEIVVLEQLTIQLAEMWNSGDLRHAGDQPYKFAARLALLSSRLNSGTAFNCKSGKDRTAQLDLEAKLLAFRIDSRALTTDSTSEVHRSTNQLPSYQESSDLENYQRQHLIFGDQSRTLMQRYNTGVEGSKLKWSRLIDTFTVNKREKKEIQSEFLGLSYRTKS